MKETETSTQQTKRTPSLFELLTSKTNTDIAKYTKMHEMT
jgi:hypothetical protein